MGWCSGTPIFDAVCEALFDEGEKHTKKILETVINAMEDMDWDCQQDSDYWDHPMVREVFMELHPSWFKEDK